MDPLRVFVLIIALSCLTLAAQNPSPGSIPPPKFYRVADVTASGRNDTVAIVGATLVDGTGKPPRENTTILVRGNRIVQVGSTNEIKIPPGTQQLPAAGKTILPGLIDMHVHLNNGPDLRLFLAAGVTSVRDVGNFTDQVTSLARGTLANDLVGPRIFYSGESFAYRGGFSSFQRATRDVSEARTEVRKRIASGASVIKIVNDITPDLVEAIVGEAHRAHVPVTADILGNRLVTAERAIALGVDGLEHVSGVPQSIAADHSPAEFSEPISMKALFGWLYTDKEKERRLIDTIVAKGTYIVPTFAVLEVNSGVPRPPDAGKDFVSDSLQALWAAVGRSSRSTSSNANSAFLTHFIYAQQFVGKLVAAGARIVAGTDMPSPGLVPGFSLHRELELLVQAGLTPSKAIQAATQMAAQFLGKTSDLGTVEAGKLADLIIVDGAPHRRISDIRNVQIVFKDGRMYDASKVSRLAKAN